MMRMTIVWKIITIKIALSVGNKIKMDSGPIDS